MASLQTVSTGHYHICFRFAGKRFKRSLKTKSEREALARKSRVEDTIRLVESGRLEVPDDADLGTFLLSDGKIRNASGKPKSEGPKSLRATFDDFFASIPAGSLEDSTLAGMRRHEKHLLRLIGGSYGLSKLSLQQLQAYVNARCGEDTHYGTKVTAQTIHKELVTLGTVWRWAERMGIVSGSFPRRGVRLPKSEELPPFQTWCEIERRVEQDGLSDEKASVWWDALYLRQEEISKLLDFVDANAAHPFICPMFVMAAHTGARRAEILRSQKSDFDFEAGFVTIREKKRVRRRNTTRRVPISNRLREVVRNWFDGLHPGAPLSFCHNEKMPRSRTGTEAGDAISPNQAHDHFERTLKESRWQKIKGWHCLRHSFISNLASLGIDQRIIDDFVGHTTEQMRRRYRHLFPDVKRNAIELVFG